MNLSSFVIVFRGKYQFFEGLLVSLGLLFFLGLLVSQGLKVLLGPFCHPRGKKVSKNRYFSCDLSLFKIEMCIFATDLHSILKIYEQTETIYPSRERDSYTVVQHPGRDAQQAAASAQSRHQAAPHRRGPCPHLQLRMLQARARYRARMDRHPRASARHV